MTREEERFWVRAERWVNDRGVAGFHRFPERPRCPMCLILPVEGSFLVNGVLLALCLECARELRTKRRRSPE